MNEITFLAIKGMGPIGAGADLAAVVLEGLTRQGLALKDKDVLVMAHKIVSKSEGRVVPLAEVAVTPAAQRLAEQTGKSAPLVQLILDESTKVVVSDRGHLICTNHLGWTCANAGIDQSNVPGKDSVVLLPKAPDESAKNISDTLFERTGCRVAVIISDTHGRPLREGITGVTIGSYGLCPLRCYVGEQDLEGKVLRVSKEAVADELAAGASLLMGQGKEGRPVVLVRGYLYEFEACTAAALKRKGSSEIFKPAGDVVL